MFYIPFKRYKLSFSIQRIIHSQYIPTRQDCYRRASDLIFCRRQAHVHLPAVCRLVIYRRIRLRRVVTAHLVIVDVDFIAVVHNLIRIVDFAVGYVKLIYIDVIVGKSDVAVCMESQSCFAVNLKELRIVDYFKVTADYLTLHALGAHDDFSIVSRQIIVHILDKSACQLAIYVCRVDK